MKERKCCGIYCLLCIPTGKRYIGSAFNCESRWLAHSSKLNNKKHGNKYLQSAWSKHGAGAFVFSIVEKCKSFDLKVREQYWINAFHSNLSKHGFNLAPAVRQNTPAEGLSKIHKDYWSSLTDEDRAARNEYKRTEAGRLLLKENADKLWADPAYRELMTVKVSATMKEHCKNPEIVELRTKSSRDYWAKPSSKRKMSERMVRQWAQLTPEERSRRGSHVKPRETTKFATLKDVTKPLKEWASESGLPYPLLLTRLNSGCPIERLFLSSYKYQATEEFARKWL
jgi:group I intron endonuclease